MLSLLLIITKGSGIIKNFTCQQCGKSFTSTANRALYCPQCRKVRQNERAKAYRNKIEKGIMTRTIGQTEICPECGNSYILKSGSQKVCENCRKEYTSKRKVKPNNDYRTKNYDSCIFYLRKGEKEKIQEYAKTHNMSLNEMVNKAIYLYIEQNK